jgi:hypothetical protein
MTSKELSGIILKETEKAFLLLLDKDKQEWFPRSQMSNINTGRIDQEITFSVPEWLYNRKYSVIKIPSRYSTDLLYEDDACEMDEIIGTYFDQW